MDNRTAIRPTGSPAGRQQGRGAGGDGGASGALTPPRRGGHAFYAEQARRALGIQHEGPLAELRAPIFHFTVGLLVAGIAVLARPQQVGLPLGIALDVVLAAMATLALLVFDRFSCPPDARPGLEGGALPTAALLAEAVVLAGTQQKPLWIPAAAVAAVVIAAAPHLSAMRLAGRDEAWLRLGRDAAGVAAMGPVLIAGCGTGPAPLRGFMLAAASFLTVVDALHTERAPRVRGLVIAAVVAVMVSVSVVPAMRGGQTAAAASLLVLWYGLRGLAAAGGGGRWSRGAVFEYGVFVAIACALLTSAVRR